MALRLTLWVEASTTCRHEANRATDRGDNRECSNELVERTVTILQAEAKKGQVSLHIDLTHDLPAFFGNGDKIRQVPTNLLLNAIQATPAQGNVWVAPDVSVQLSHAAGATFFVELPVLAPGVAGSS